MQSAFPVHLRRRDVADDVKEDLLELVERRLVYVQLHCGDQVVRVKGLFPQKAQEVGLSGPPRPTNKTDLAAARWAVEVTLSHACDEVLVTGSIGRDVSFGRYAFTETLDDLFGCGR